MIRYENLTQNQKNVVVQLMAEYLSERWLRLDYDDAIKVTAPIVPGQIRHSHGGLPWVTFDGGRLWYRLMSVDPKEPGVSVFEPVLDPDGRPLGVGGEGVVCVVSIHGRDVAIVCNTGWNYENEVIWGDAA